VQTSAENNAGQPKRDNPFQEEEDQGNEHTRRAPGIERDYQGELPEEKRAPGEEQDDDDTQDIDRKIA
jgi:hypothetical protein